MPLATSDPPAEAAAERQKAAGGVAAAHSPGLAPAVVDRQGRRSGYAARTAESTAPVAEDSRDEGVSGLEVDEPSAGLGMKRTSGPVARMSEEDRRAQRRTC